MEKPEIIWHYKPVRMQERFTSEIYWHEYPICIVSRDKIQHYRKQIRTTLYHEKPPFNLVAEFEGEKIVVWSSDPTVQEHSKQLLANWQQLENYYSDLLEYCKCRKESMEKALQLIDDYKTTEKPIDYCPPNIRWTLYKSGLKIEENYVNNSGKSFTNRIFIRTGSHSEIDYWAMFDEIFNYIISKRQDSEMYNRNRYRQIQLVFDYLRKNSKMVVQIATKDFWDKSRTWKNDIVPWSTDQAEQEAIRQRFSCWKTIEQFYNQYCERWKIYCSFNSIEDFMKEREIKTEQRIKRDQNDPTNPATRKRRARRHLQRLGYDLHISRKAVFNGKKYQIIELDSREIVAWKNCDLTLEQVETFYCKNDTENADS